MGINYYATFPIAKRDGTICRIRRHVGKSSYGWSFSFRGYKPAQCEDGGPSISSYREWIDCLLLEGARLFDEDGGQYGIEWFVELVRSKRSGINHTDYCKERKEGWPLEIDTEKDKDGHSFSFYEFS